MRTSDNNGPRQHNRPGFKLGPLPPPTFSQAPTPTSMPINYTPTSGYTPQSYTVAQQQLQLQQREIIQQATRGLLPPHLGPISPRLIPLGSPGPVTPLALEDGQSSYLTIKREFALQQQDYEKLVAAQSNSGKQ